ncbi:hypothetical protein PsYK624_099850 [Phanerochaete sordida]|uniref:Reverse transcriptase zinc-binding domain-containing protein n=1 Tax=Phanerochaete sordida TaxID=48140 RepID=A0A9P3LFS1_9APHY|nr:hypothetical protein PsYK624_099850 [Phanerochaete sordida]
MWAPSVILAAPLPLVASTRRIPFYSATAVVYCIAHCASHLREVSPPAIRRSRTSWQRTAQTPQRPTSPAVRHQPEKLGQPAAQRNPNGVPETQRCGADGTRPWPHRRSGHRVRADAAARRGSLGHSPPPARGPRLPAPPLQRAHGRVNVWLNQCIYPLEGPTAKSFARSARIIPAAWLIALDVLRDQHLSIRPTDLSHLFSGSVSLRHIIRTQAAPPTSPSSHVITNLERAGVSTLQDVAIWDDILPSSIISARCPALRPRGMPVALRGRAAERDWPSFAPWLSRLTLQDLVYGFFGYSLRSGSLGGLDAARAANGRLGSLDAARALYGSLGSPGAVRESPRSAIHCIPPSCSPPSLWSLAIPRPIRKYFSESLFLCALRLSRFPALHSSYSGFLASDASALQSPSHSSHVTFAATSPSGSLAMQYSPPTASSLHGEVLGLIAASLIHLHHPVSPDSPTLYTDHLNSVRYISSSLTLPSSHRLPASPAQPLYSWLIDILRRSPNAPSITYTPAHTSSTSLPASLNRYVDALASVSHTPLARSLVLPYPTFTLPDFALYSPLHGFITSDISSFLSSCSTQLILSDPSFRPNITMFRHLYDAHEPPLHPYTRASSAYSAVVQLYARSAQLDDAFTRYHRFGDVAPTCRFGCSSDETPHHIFVACPHYAHLRRAAMSAILEDTSRQLDAAETISDIRDVVLQYTRSLFSDDAAVWPQYSSRYYLGTMPHLPCPTTTVAQQRLAARIMNGWHLGCIRLAGRIWGDYKRLTASRALHPISPLSLPAHLSHLL